MQSAAAEKGQVSKTAAEIYDEFFVPSLFGQWAGPLCEAAGVEPGQAVLDVACGTGATTREAATRVQPGGRVTGLDCNSGMLAVASARAPDIRWVEDRAEELPFPDDSFDAVLCQFALMFFEDRARALSEMRRVLRPGGRLALSVWDEAANSPGYDAMIALIETMFGKEAADALRAPFVLGERARLSKVLEAGGLAGAEVATKQGTARFASIREWVRMDVRGWTLAEFIDDDDFEALVKEAERTLRAYEGADGAVAFPAPAHIVTWS